MVQKLSKKTKEKTASKKEKETKKAETKKKQTVKQKAPKKEVSKAVSKVEPKKAERVEFEEGIEKEFKTPKKKLTYYYAVGRRKSAIAKVFLFKNGEGKVEINGRDLKNFFPWELFQVEVMAPLLAVGQKDKLNVKCIVKGGGIRGQAEAIRLAMARALLNLNPVFRRALKKHSYLTRDPRVKERKKYGLKRARRAPQWKKR
jgi:small subunit ribosomal protein S9